jgi:hypothetical protein
VKLTPDQLAELEEHLRGALDGHALAEAVAGIEYAVEWVAVEEFARDHDTKRRHYDHDRRILEAATQLRALLRTERPMWGMRSPDWLNFDDVLARIIHSTTETTAQSPVRRRGRPPEHWRDQLIAVIRGVYPDDAETTTSSHFVGTVELVLVEMVGHNVEDVGSVIRGALRRCPDPPFRVTITKT